MTHLAFRKHIGTMTLAATLVAVGSTQGIAQEPATAQQPVQTGATTVPADDRDDGMDLGWIGLLGLAGLLGLRRRDHHVTHVDRVERVDTTPRPRV